MKIIYYYQGWGKYGILKLKYAHIIYFFVCICQNMFFLIFIIAQKYKCQLIYKLLEGIYITVKIYWKFLILIYNICKLLLILNISLNMFIANYNCFQIN